MLPEPGVNVAVDWQGSLFKLMRMGQTMRRLQKEYFRTRSQQVLNECRDAEKRFDKAVKIIENLEHPTLPFEENQSDVAS